MPAPTHWVGAATLPLAMFAALWVTRLQHERDFVGMYAGNLVVSLALVIGLSVAAKNAASATDVLSLLGTCLVFAMIGRLAWLGWSLPASPEPVVIAPETNFPRADIWLWAALLPDIVLLFSLVAQTFVLTAGERFLASFNYACKLIELPLVTVLAFQLVVCLAFTTIIRTQKGPPGCKQKVS